MTTPTPTKFQVKLTLHGAVEDEGFLRFLEKAAVDAGRPLTTHDLVVLNAVHRDHPIPEAAKGSIVDLVDRGLLERAAKRRLVLARKYHRLLGRPGDYTRNAGLDRATQKALLVKHIRENPGSPLGEVLPNLTAKQVQTLLGELKRDGTIRSEGRTKAGRWFPV